MTTVVTSTLPSRAPASDVGVLPTTRITSIDAFRGFVMFLMLAEAMRLWTLEAAYPGNTFWSLVAFNTTHVPWRGWSLRAQIGVFVTILVGFWAAFMLYPAPDHFAKNANLSWAFDVWFLNLFPREAPFHFNEGGWSTLSFVPTLATMLLGLWAGMWLKTPRSTDEKLEGLAAAGVALALAGLALQWLHICPIVKRIWTSSYTLYSGGLGVLMLARLPAAIERQGWKRWSFPLLVIGAN